MTSTTTMLLRSSSSSSTLNSWLPHSNHSSAEPEIIHQIPRITRSITLSASSSPKGVALPRVLSDSDLSSSVHMPWVRPPSRTTSLGPALFSFSELTEGDGAGCGGGVGGGGIGIGGGRGGWGSWDSNYDNDPTDEYYRAMIAANPGNPLFLSNYARYLKEVCGDYVRAEEYCARAILADQNDGKVLSLYADLIWESHKDAPRAECYYDQAVKAAPDDCYVLASYAHFLWDATEAGELGEEDSSQNSPSFFHGGIPPAPPSPLATAA
ncbi:hypothetical protein HN51_044231 [Arachis hypogaea]|uniref:Uncharacterized protein n=2 Tax=Arachis TaxID=3817 RepID=A0A444Y3F5_ARAHY|nr:uncharacterized protein LOC107613969 isoform X1 [Arachis ipaensis]XP_025673108.1 uncharacterized protein LOC112772388 isoform X1 [Arachis hypogaea]RYQ96481.1 hypothetical protein Ahy_B08g092239 [Arachis hypogaea]